MRDADAILGKRYADGPKLAAVGLTRHGKLDIAEQLPSACPWSLDDICCEDWCPTPPDPR